MKERLIYITILTFLGYFFIASLGIGVYLYSQSQNKDEDLSVLLNAKPETDYPSTAFIFSQKVNGSTFLCGATVVTKQYLITAAHCLADSVKVKVGTNNEIFLGEPLKEVDFFTVHSQWINAGSDTIKDALNLNVFSTYTDNDLGILKIKDSTTPFTKFSEIDAFEDGCDYEIAAYGSTLSEVNKELKFPRIKESIQVCLTSHNEKTVKVTPAIGTGICLGDSGSPIYYKDTNKVVAILSMVLSDDTQQLCKINNIGLATLIQPQQEFIAEHIQVSPEDNLATNQTIEESNIVTNEDEVDVAIPTADEEIEELIESYRNQVQDYQEKDEIESTQQILPQTQNIVETNTSLNDSTKSSNSFVSINIPYNILIVASFILSAIFLSILTLVLIIIYRKRRMDNAFKPNILINRLNKI